MINLEIDTIRLNEHYQIYKEGLDKALDSKVREVNLYKKLLTKLKFKIEIKREEILKLTGICIYNYWEWNTDEPDVNSRLINAIRLWYDSLDTVDKYRYSYILVDFSKYIDIIKHLDECIKLIKVIKTRKTISFKKYRYYVMLYYMEVCGQLLDGKYYKFTNNIGTLVIERIQFENNERNFINWGISNKKKKEILDRGGELYDREKWLTAMMKGEEYKGEKYLEFESSNYIYRIKLFDSKFRHRAATTLKPVTYTRKGSVEQLLKTHPTYLSIRNDSKLDLKTKIVLSIQLDKANGLKYIRNAEQRPIVHRLRYRKS